MSKSNFYILLELPLDPPELDWGKVKAAIHSKKMLWSRERSMPGKGIKAKAQLELIGEMTHKLEQLEFRKACAAEALNIKRERDKEQFLMLDEAITMVSLKGYVKEEELLKLGKRFITIPEEVIRKRIEAPIRKVQRETVEKKKPLESGLARQIASDLEIVGEKSLYDFLGLGRKSSRGVLLDAARKMDVANKRIAKKTARVTAVGNLVGHCLNIFRSEDKREAYHRTLTEASLSALHGALDIAGLDKTILAVEYDQLMKKGVSLGLSRGETEELISNYARKRSWHVERPGKLSVDEMVACGQCGVVNARKNNACCQCGSQLETECPVCETQVSNSHRACTQCGFAIGDLPFAKKLLRLGLEALSGGKLRESVTHLKSVLVYWPGQKEAVEALAAIKGKEDDLQRLSQILQTAMRERRYYAASEALKQLARINATHKHLTLESDIKRYIRSAEAKVAMAKRQSDPELTLDFYLEALALCEDCQSAVDGVAKSPPASPGPLSVISKGDVLALKWAASASKKEVSYKVIRKEMGQPARYDDGESLTNTTQCLFDDTSTQPGRHYYYAVYTMRKNTPSREPALCGPVMRIGELTNLTVHAGDGRLDFSWRQPNGVQAVEVWRKKGALPVRLGDGTRVNGVRPDGFSEGGLRNGLQYGYLLACIFRGPDGRVVKSRGLARFASPVQPPPPINDLRLNKVGKQLELRWTPPSKGLVHFFQSSTKPTTTAGTQINTTRLSELGKALPIREKASALVDVKGQGVVWISPATVCGDLAVVGISASHTLMEDVSGLKGILTGHRICLDWMWPSGADSVQISYGYQASPTSPFDPTAVHKRVTLGEYERSGGFVLENPRPKIHYFKVFVKGDNDLYSGGVACQVVNGERREIFYEILLKKSLFGKIKRAYLRIYTTSGSCVLPHAVLVKKKGRLPIGRNDGESICRIPAGTTIDGDSMLFDIPNRALGKGAFARLFCEDISHKETRFMSPDKSKLSLS